MLIGFLSVTGVVLLTLWLAILPLVYVVPVLELRWKRSGVLLNAFEYMIVCLSDVVSSYRWILLPLLFLVTILWTYCFYRAVFSPDDLPE